MFHLPDILTFAIGSKYGILRYICLHLSLNEMVNAGKYSIHGFSGDVKIDVKIGTIL